MEKHIDTAQKPSQENQTNSETFDRMMRLIKGQWRTSLLHENYDLNELKQALILLDNGIRSKTDKGQTAERQKLLQTILQNICLIIRYSKNTFTPRVFEYPHLLEYLIHCLLTLQETLAVYKSTFPIQLSKLIEKYIADLSSLVREYKNDLPENRVGTSGVKKLLAIADPYSVMYLKYYFIPLSNKFNVEKLDQIAKLVELYEEQVKQERKWKRSKNFRSVLNEINPDISSPPPNQEAKTMITSQLDQIVRDCFDIFNNHKYQFYLPITAREELVGIVKIFLNAIEGSRTKATQKIDASLERFLSGELSSKIETIIFLEIEDYFSSQLDSDVSRFRLDPEYHEKFIAKIKRLAFLIFIFLNKVLGIKQMDTLIIYKNLIRFFDNGSKDEICNFVSRIKDFISSKKSTKEYFSSHSKEIDDELSQIETLCGQIDAKGVQNINKRLRFLKMKTELLNRLFGKKYSKWRTSVVALVLSTALVGRVAADVIGKFILSESGRGIVDNNLDNVDKDDLPPPPVIKGKIEKVPRPSDKPVEVDKDYPLGFNLTQGSVEGQIRELLEMSPQLRESLNDMYLYTPYVLEVNTSIFHAFRIPINWEVMGYYFSPKTPDQVNIYHDSTTGMIIVKGEIDDLNNLVIVAQPLLSLPEYKSDSSYQSPFMTQENREKFDNLLTELDTLGTEPAKELANNLKQLVANINETANQDQQTQKESIKQYIQNFRDFYLQFIQKHFYYSLLFNDYHIENRDSKVPVMLQMLQELKNGTYKGHNCYLAEISLRQILEILGLPVSTIDIANVYKRGQNLIQFVGHTFNLIDLEGGITVVIDSTPPIKEGKTPENTDEILDVGQYEAVTIIGQEFITKLVNFVDSVVSKFRGISPMFLVSLFLGILIIKRIRQKSGSNENSKEVELVEELTELTDQLTDCTDNDLYAFDFLIKWILSFDITTINSLLTEPIKVSNVKNIFTYLTQFDFIQLYKAASFVSQIPANKSEGNNIDILNIEVAVFQELINSENDKSGDLESLRAYFNSLNPEEKIKFCKLISIVIDIETGKFVNEFLSKMNIVSPTERENKEEIRSRVFWDILFKTKQ